MQTFSVFTLFRKTDETLHSQPKKRNEQHRTSVHNRARIASNISMERDDSKEVVEMHRFSVFHLSEKNFENIAQNSKRRAFTTKKREMSSNRTTGLATTGQPENCIEYTISVWREMNFVTKVERKFGEWRCIHRQSNHLVPD